MSTLIDYFRNKTVYFALTVALLALYAPAKDLLQFAGRSVASASIELSTISYGGNRPWGQSDHQSHFVKASQSLRSPQDIYTKFTLKNPTNAPQTYRKIWLYFEHENGDREYTTDYTLYDPATRQRLIGQSIELGPKSEVTVLAAYRYIPSYQSSAPATVSLSWETQAQMRAASCQYKLPTDSLSQFGVSCE